MISRFCNENFYKDLFYVKNDNEVKMLLKGGKSEKKSGSL